MNDWNEFRKTLNFTEAEEDEMRIEREIIYAIAKAREERGISQRQLAKISGLPQPVISRLEKSTHSPQINTLIRALTPLGYTLKVVPKEKV